MISKFSLRNFKGFNNAEIDIHNINLFIGANSAGKSSCLKGLMLGYQFLSSGIKKNGELPSIGPLVFIYEPRSVFKDKKSNDTFTLTFNLDTAIDFQSLLLISLGSAIDKKLTEDAHNFTNDDSAKRILGENFCEQFMTFIQSPIYTQKTHNRITEKVKQLPLEHGDKAAEINNMIENKISAFKHSRLAGKASFAILEHTFRQIKICVEHGQSNELSLQSFEIDSEDNHKICGTFDKDFRIKSLSTTIKPLSTYFEEFSGIDINVTAHEATDESPTKKVSHSYYRMLIHNIIGGISTQTTPKIFHVSPLRGHPKEYYSTHGYNQNFYSTSSDEYTASLLHKYPELVEKINDWLIRLGHEVSVGEVASRLRSLRMDASRLNLSITDVGFGVSQIIPVLAACYFAPQGSIVLIEQPEIHLHPSAQAVLADFFIEVARSGVKLIIETHSEALLRRLRRRMAELIAKDGHEVATNFLAIYGFEKEDGNCVVNKIEVEESGNFQLPANFWDFEKEDLIGFLTAQRAQHE